MSSQSEDQGMQPTSVGVECVLSSGSKSSARSTMSSAREPGDLVQACEEEMTSRQTREGEEPQAAVVERQKSDEVVVPKKSAKTRVTPVETMEGRTEAKGKSAARNAFSTLGEDNASTNLQRIGKRRTASLPVDPRWEPGAGNPLAGICPGGGPQGPSLPGRRRGVRRSGARCTGARGASGGDTRRPRGAGGAGRGVRPRRARPVGSSPAARSLISHMPVQLHSTRLPTLPAPRGC